MSREGSLPFDSEGPSSVRSSSLTSSSVNNVNDRLVGAGAISIAVAGVGTNGHASSIGRVNSPNGSIVSPIVVRRRARSDLIGGIAALASPSPSPLPPSRPDTPGSGTSSVLSGASTTPSGSGRPRRRLTTGSGAAQFANSPNSEWYLKFQKNSFSGAHSRLVSSPESSSREDDRPEFGDPITAGHGYSMDHRRNKLRG